MYGSGTIRETHRDVNTIKCWNPLVGYGRTTQFTYNRLDLSKWCTSDRGRDLPVGAKFRANEAIIWKQDVCLDTKPMAHLSRTLDHGSLAGTDNDCDWCKILRLSKVDHTELKKKEKRQPS